MIAQEHQPGAPSTRLGGRLHRMEMIPEYTQRVLPQHEGEMENVSTTDDDI